MFQRGALRLACATQDQFYHEKLAPYAGGDRLSLLNVPDDNEFSFVKSKHLPLGEIIHKTKEMVICLRDLLCQHERLGSFGCP